MASQNTVLCGKNSFYQFGCGDSWYYFAWECAKETCAGWWHCLSSEFKHAQGMSIFLLRDDVQGKQGSQKNPFPQTFWSVMICWWCNSLWLPFLILFQWAVSCANSNDTGVREDSGRCPAPVVVYSCAKDFGEGSVRSGLSSASG